MTGFFPLEAWLDALAARFLLWLPQALVGLAIVAATALAARGAGRLVRRLEERRRLDPTLGTFLGAVARVAIWAIGLVTAAGTVGLAILPVLSGLGVVGLALGLAAQDTLGNLMSGIIILWDRPFVVGDVLVLDGVEGEVQSIALRTTRLMTPDREVVIIPNKRLTETRLTNRSALAATRVRVAVEVEAARADAVREALLAAARSVEGVLAAFPPEVATTDYQSGQVTLEVQAYARPAERRVVQERLVRAVAERAGAG